MKAIYENGATHHDHHKELTIHGDVSKTEMRELLDRFFADAEEATVLPDDGAAEGAAAVAEPGSGRPDVRDQLLPCFLGNEELVGRFVRGIRGAEDRIITGWVKRMTDEGLIQEAARKRILWRILHDAGLYHGSESNWNSQV